MKFCVYRQQSLCLSDTNCSGCPLAIKRNTAMVTQAIVDLLLSIKKYYTYRTFSSAFYNTTGLVVNLSSLRKIVGKLEKLGYVKRRRLYREIEFRAVDPVPIFQHQAYYKLVERHKNNRRDVP